MQKTFICPVSLKAKSDIVWYMQSVSEKVFHHLQISMISVQNISVTFKFVSNLPNNLRTEVIL